MTVERGTKKIGKVLVGQVAFGADVYIPVLIIHGQKEGPTFWANSAIHGDELNGSVASWELFHELNPEDVSGTLIFTPISNPLAFENRDKVSDVDMLDMDTAFPGDPNGLFAQRVAYILFKEIKKHATYLLNFHTLNTQYKAVPYTVSKIVPNASEEIVRKSREMALIFGTETNCVVNLATAAGELPGVTNGALDITCIQNNIPAFMAEVGSGGKIEEEYVSIAKEGLKNLFVHLGFISGEIDKPERQYIITKRKFLRADYGGLVSVKVEPGEKVEAGTVLAETHYFGEEIYSTKFNENSYIIATRVNPVVNTGDRLAFVGLEWEEVK